MIESEIINRYLDLLRNTLTFSLWKEPPAPIDEFMIKGSITSWGRKLIAKILRKFNIQLVIGRNISESQMADSQYWSLYADTMVGLKRLDNVRYCIENVLKNNIKGDIIETGVWRGGTCIFMRGVLKAYNIEDRKVFVADSFQGLPEPNSDTYPEDKGDKLSTYEFLGVSEDQVKNNFKRYNLLDDQVVFLKGWFKNTLPIAPITKISILRLDGDMYESTMDSLNALYPKLSSGGFCIIDDYALPPCKSAVDRYREEHKITEEIISVDGSCIYWRKI